MTTVATIAASAFTAVAEKVSGVIHTATVTRTTTGAYDPSTGGVTTSTETDIGRMVIATTTPIKDVFPDHVPGPSDLLAYIEGLDTIAPVEADRISANSKTYTITRSLDLLGAGGLYAVIMQGA